MLRNMFKKTYTKIDTKFKSQGEAQANIPQGMWRKCNKCGQPIYVEDVKNNFYVCPKCGGYFRVHAYRRIEMIADEGSFEEWNKEMPFCNPLDFPGYEKKVLAAREKTRLDEAIVIGKCAIEGNPAVMGVCDARFIMSSMGHVVGEKITQAVERATAEKLPVILFACSGGARMQEGIVSLMQMAKTSAALKRHHEAGQLFVTVLTDPTSYEEVSGSAAIAAGILKGIKLGILDSSFEACAEKAIEGICANVAEDGTVLNVSGGTGMGYDADHYKNIVIHPMAYGQSLTLIALCEALK